MEVGFPERRQRSGAGVQDVVSTMSTTSMTPLPPLPPQPTDADLLDRWLAGEETSLALLVRRHAGLVHRSCRRQLGSADADDAAQAVFLVLAQKAHAAAAVPVLEAWLLAVARRVCANAVRIRRRRVRREQESTTMMAAQSPDASIPIELIRDLDTALADLPVHEREAITGHFLGGHTQAELARLCNCAEGTMRSRVHRGLEHLRHWFVKRGHGVTPAMLLAALLVEQQAAADESAHAVRHLLLERTSQDVLVAPSANARLWAEAGRHSWKSVRLVAAALLAIVSLVGIVRLSDPATGLSVNPTSARIASESDRTPAIVSHRPSTKAVDDPAPDSLMAVNDVTASFTIQDAAHPVPAWEVSWSGPCRWLDGMWRAIDDKNKQLESEGLRTRIAFGITSANRRVWWDEFQWALTPEARAALADTTRTAPAEWQGAAIICIASDGDSH
ncbi:MAG: RNA polymerase sigma factor, partial [Planctomycetes bacterium]|nr:RNA polymerase sigma factor [Planctomycetota bacterium]